MSKNVKKCPKNTTENEFEVRKKDIFMILYTEKRILFKNFLHIIEFTHFFSVIELGLLEIDPIFS